MACSLSAAGPPASCGSIVRSTDLVRSLVPIVVLSSDRGIAAHDESRPCLVKQSESSSSSLYRPLRTRSLIWPCSSHCPVVNFGTHLTMSASILLRDGSEECFRAEKSPAGDAARIWEMHHGYGTCGLRQLVIHRCQLSSSPVRSLGPINPLFPARQSPSPLLFMRPTDHRSARSPDLGKVIHRPCCISRTISLISRVSFLVSLGRITISESIRHSITE